MSGANDTATVSEGNESVADTKPHEAPIKVIKGNPSAEEVAALVTVLSGASGGPAAPEVQERNPWGHPVDKLRYEVFSWQRVTLLERTHMRR